MRSTTAAAIWSSPNTDPPPAELQVRGDHHRLRLVGIGEDLEEQPRPVRVEREKPELVDDEQASPADERGLPAGPPVIVGAPQAHHERGRREEARLEPPLARQRAEGRRHVRLAGADVAHEHEVLPALGEVEREQRLAAHPLRPRHGRPAVAVECVLQLLFLGFHNLIVSGFTPFGQGAGKTLLAFRPAHH